MKEFPFVCTACDSSFPGPAELSVHLVTAHEPKVIEPVLELFRRPGDVAAERELVRRNLEDLVGHELAPEDERHRQLVALRAAAAAAIAGSLDQKLPDIRKELAVLEETCLLGAMHLTRIGRIASESAEAIARVLELGEVPPP